MRRRSGQDHLLHLLHAPKVLAETCDVVVNPVVGPEALTGSTRLKRHRHSSYSNITTNAMIRMGKVYGN